MSNSSNRCLRNFRSQAGFTLLEILLTLSLSVVLAALVGGAMQFYARDMNVRDMDIRQTLLASAILQMIEDDLRATLHSEPVDTAPLEAVLAATASTVSGGGQSQGGASDSEQSEDLSAAGIDSEPLPAESESASAVDLQTGAAVLQTPGLIGNQYQIQIDLSELPRLEEYVTMLDQTAADIDDVPSDIKTVSYYVQSADTIGGVQDPLELLAGDQGQTNSGGGLVRRSLDRAASVFATESGNLVSLNQSGELLAPEVMGIEFAYWDGYTWLMEWSSDEFGELPLAVRVNLYMPSPTADPAAAGSSGSSTFGSAAASSANSDAVRTFTHIVRLPMAKPIPEEDVMGTGTSMGTGQ